MFRDGEITSAVEHKLFFGAIKIEACKEYRGKLATHPYKLHISFYVFGKRVFSLAQRCHDHDIWNYGLYSETGKWINHE